VANKNIESLMNKSRTTLTTSPGHVAHPDSASTPMASENWSSRCLRRDGEGGKHSSCARTSRVLGMAVTGYVRAKRFQCCRDEFQAVRINHRDLLSLYKLRVSYQIKGAPHIARHTLTSLHPSRLPGPQQKRTPEG
jgi:hypothetical protein